MKKAHLFIIVFQFFIILNDCTQAQTIEWARSIGGASDEKGYNITYDKYGNVYITGSFMETVDFDPGPDTFDLTAYSYNVYIAKYDNNGNYLWAKSIDGGWGEGHGIKIDTMGNIYITGWIGGTVDFDPGPGVAIFETYGAVNIFFAKYDNNGNYLWAKVLEGPGSNGNRGNSINLDTQGNIFITGKFNGTIDFDTGIGIANLTSGGYNTYFAKYDTDGNYLWARCIYSTNENYGNDISIDVQGNVYVTGNFWGNTYFAPGPSYLLNGFGSVDIYITKYDSIGNFVWVKIIGGTFSDYSEGIAIDMQGYLHITGSFNGTCDFDPGIGTANLSSASASYFAKYDSDGNFIWVKKIEDCGSQSIDIDSQGNSYVLGDFQGTTDFNPDSGTVFITSAGYNDIFYAKYNLDGNLLWVKSISGFGWSWAHNIKLDDYGNVYLIGCFRDTVNYNPQTGTGNLISEGYLDIFFLKLTQKGVSGIIYNDINQNCFRDPYENGLQNRYLIINPGNIIAQTNEVGAWVIDSLPVGTYTATFDTSGHWMATCPVSQTFTVTNQNEITFAPHFGLKSTQPCSSPDLSVYMPSIRPCFGNQKIYVQACNRHIATGILAGAYVDIGVDPLITPQFSSLPFTNLGNNIFRVIVGDLYPGEVVSFTIDCDVSCTVTPGQTLCVQANIYPADSCVFDTIPNPYPGNFTPCSSPWDKSIIDVEGYCENDTIHFVIYNNGNPVGGDMVCYSPVRLYIDGIYTMLDSVMIPGGDSLVFTFSGDGRTWRMEADQNPLFPGNSNPSATVELCGDSINWTSGLVTILPLNDFDPVVDIYCGVATGSMDPNDKTGYPTGLSSNNEIMPNQQLQYVIRFQNTGTDTAFTVVIRDTLDMNFDIFTVVPGVASHNYNFQMYGPRVLEWTFNNILLPDSNVNETESHGFVTFTVNQNSNLPSGTVIYNEADIYFDFNAPITTNQVWHTINDQIQTIISVYKETDQNITSDILVYPNPAGDNLFIEIKNADLFTSADYSLYGITGNKIVSGVLTDGSNQINVSSLRNGIYYMNVSSNVSDARFKIVIVK
ncbi:MAG: T9SS type A sorting domain-containing protein [Bacteroidota bacterium]